MKPHYSMMAGYNAWANARVYEAAASLSDAQYRADRGAFFKSVHGTLNHLLATDRIWLRRFTGEGDAPNSLDAILFDALDDLRSARVAEDARIVAYVESLTEGDLDGAVTLPHHHQPGRRSTQPLGPALAHLFNHQTHHRGQVHGLLTGLGLAAPSLDLILYQRETGQGMS